MNNLREINKPRTEHEDFECLRSAPTADFYNTMDRRHRSRVSKIREGYWDFAICWWGDLGRIVEIGEDKGGNYMLIKDLTEDKSVRQRMEDIDWKNNLMICTGAPQLTLEMFIEIYDKHRNRR